ncbi:MAG TPA: hypothetical protein DEP18_00100 [Flavobacteriales bacterium]|nr:hypothetical protein [Flavobacteriales bacterium]HRE73616.1 ATP-binding protein [Flavobacteriales bacterium]HRE95327.1 ATP-binding protein [Flavobacteriales bacterium]HRJ35263.1 ATP-binding protein [Flavobacteriales bacterium]HRJ37251.1 ATP-binding protein [Flavobacteriales bacterium]
MQSPFVYGRIAEGSAFANRKQELQRLSGNLRNKINTIVLGPRRIGKTSLVRKITAEYSGLSYYRFCYIDAYKVNDEESFYSYFASEVIKACSSNVEEAIEYSRQLMAKSSSRLAVSLTQSRDYNLAVVTEDEIGDDAMDFGNEIARKKNFTLIICIDNFQNIERFEQSLLFQKKFKTAIEKHDKTVYCIAGTRTSFLNDAFLNPDQPLYQMGDLIQLDRIALDELAPLIMNRFSESGKSCAMMFAERICKEMVCHPYFTQQLAHIVYMNANGKVDDAVISRSVEEMIERNLVSFQREYENLSILQANFLRMLLDGVEDGFTTKPMIEKYKLSSSAAVIRVIDSLLKKEVIERRQGKFCFVDPTFHYWMQRVVKG